MQTCSITLYQMSLVLNTNVETGYRGYRRKEGEYKAISTSISVHVKLSIFLNNLLTNYAVI